MKSFQRALAPLLCALTVCGLASCRRAENPAHEIQPRPDWAMPIAKGRVLDQYGHPVPGARIAFSYARAGIGPNDILSESETIFTDNDGRFEYRAEHRRTPSYLIDIWDSIGTDGNFYRRSRWGQTITMHYSQKLGWTQSLRNHYDPVNGWSSEYLPFGESKLDDELLLGAARSGPPEGLLHTLMDSLKVKDKEPTGMDVLRGRAHAKQEDSDFFLITHPCQLADGAALEVRAAAGNQLLAFDRTRMSESDQPDGRYTNRLVVIPENCRASVPGAQAAQRPDELERSGDMRRREYTFYFTARKGLLRGVVKILQVKPDQHTYGTRPTSVLRVEITANPRGERNLLFDPNLEAHMLEFPMAYSVAESGLDFKKVELREDPIAGTMTITGKPGALLWAGCHHLANDGPGQTSQALPQQDGSFTLTFPGRLGDKGRFDYCAKPSPEMIAAGHTDTQVIDFRRLRILSKKAKAGQPLTLLPWTDESHLDFSKIYVSEDGDKGEVTVRGEPGSTPHPCTWASIAGLRENGSTKQARTNRDGSFTLTVKGDLRELARLYVATYPVEYCGQTDGDGQFYYLMPLKLKSEAARAALANSAPVSK